MAEGHTSFGEPGERAISQRSCTQDWSVDQSEVIKKPFIIGVTGGIASGKSSIARMFAGRGIAHVDADKLVHHLLQHDRAVITEIAAAIPAAKNATGGGIDRAKLAAHIAAHPQALALLESILHPRVRGLEERAIETVRRMGLRALVLDVPLMYETGADELCDVVIAATAPLAHRRRRAFARPGMTEAKWARLTARQWPDADRNHLADIVIPTSAGKAATRRQVQRLMREWGLV